MNIHVYEEGWQGTGISEVWQVAAFSRLRHCGEIRDWCCDTFGMPGEHWRDDLVWGEVRFRNPEELDLFLLKWGGDVAAPDN